MSGRKRGRRQGWEREKMERETRVGEREIGIGERERQGWERDREREKDISVRKKRHRQGWEREREKR